MDGAERGSEEPPDGAQARRVTSRTRPGCSPLESPLLGGMGVLVAAAGIVWFVTLATTSWITWGLLLAPVGLFLLGLWPQMSLKRADLQMQLGDAFGEMLRDSADSRYLEAPAATPRYAIEIVEGKGEPEGPARLELSQLPATPPVGDPAAARKRFYERFWAQQHTQFTLWRRGLLQTSTFHFWLTRRLRGLAGSEIYAGLTPGEGWNQVAETVRETDFGDFMKHLVDDMLESTSSGQDGAAYRWRQELRKDGGSGGEEDGEEVRRRIDKHLLASCGGVLRSAWIARWWLGPGTRLDPTVYNEKRRVRAMVAVLTATARHRTWLNPLLLAFVVAALAPLPFSDADRTLARAIRTSNEWLPAVPEIDDAVLAKLGPDPLAIPFELGKAQLSPGQRESLRGFAQAAGHRSIVIACWTDTSGPSGENSRLAVLRCRRVREVLEEIVPREQIRMRAYGEDALRDPTENGVVHDGNRVALLGAFESGVVRSAYAFVLERMAHQGRY